MEKKTIGSFIAALRKAGGLTQKQFAEKLNVSDKTISRWERDECAPDLTLIPVIAEIFGITTDELLRGQRATPHENPSRAAEKTEKQLRHLIKNTQTRYTARSCISIGIALVGLIAAMIGNLGFLRAYVGFLAGCIFFVAAAVCQSIFLILGRAALESDEFDSAVTAACRKKLTLGAEIVFGIIAVLLAACLPLLFVPEAYAGLDGASWLAAGLLCAGAGAFLAGLIGVIINAKLGYWEPKKPSNRLYIQCIALLLSALLILGIGHWAFASYLSEHLELLTTYTEFDNWDDFITFMQTPTAPDGTKLYLIDTYYDGSAIQYVYETESGESYTFAVNDMKESVCYKGSTIPLIEYRNINLNVGLITYGEDHLLPVKVFTRSELNQANRRGELLCLAYAVLYLIVIFETVIYYRKKKKSCI